MDPASCFKIGYIQKTHGLKGEVTMVLDANVPDELEDISIIYLGDEHHVVPYFIETLSGSGLKLFLKLEDIDGIDEAQDLVRKSIFLEKSSRPKKGRGEFYDDEVTDFLVTDDEAGELGKVIGIVHAGPNRLLSIDHQGREVLVPVEGPFIISINKTKKTVRVSLPDGFLDI